VLANRILFNEGIVDGYGHVSIRDPGDPTRFFQSRNIAPALVTEADMLVHDLDGNVLSGQGDPALERFIHAAIYAKRPDVGAIVHSHAASMVLFGVIDVPLRPLWLVSGFLGDGVAMFDSKAEYGDTDLLISDMERGRALAKVLADKPVALMRGHGSACVGSSLKEVVYRAIYTDANAKLQAQAALLGSVTYLSPVEAQLCSELSRRPKVVAKPWDLWRRAVDHEVLE